MKRIIIIVFIIAGVLDIIVHQIKSNKEQFHMLYDAEKKFDYKNLYLKIKLDCQLYNFEDVKLKPFDEDFYINSHKVINKKDGQEYLIFHDLEEGTYSIEMIDNFKHKYFKIITLKKNRTFSYNDLMEDFYPQQNATISYPHYFADTLRINTIIDNSTCQGYNIKIYYEDDLNILMLEYLNRSKGQNNSTDTETFIMKNEFLRELNSLEKNIWIMSNEVVVKEQKHKQGIFEFVIENRRVYYTSTYFENGQYFSDKLLELIEEFVLEEN